MKPHILNDYEIFCLDNAVKFTAVRGKASTKIRQEFDTMKQAEDFAAHYGDKRTMIYAITATDMAAHIKNV